MERAVWLEKEEKEEGERSREKESRLVDLDHLGGVVLGRRGLAGRLLGSRDEGRRSGGGSRIGMTGGLLDRFLGRNVGAGRRRTLLAVGRGRSLVWGVDELGNANRRGTTGIDVGSVVLWGKNETQVGSLNILTEQTKGEIVSDRATGRRRGKEKKEERAIEPRVACWALSRSCCWITYWRYCSFGLLSCSRTM